MYRATLRTTSAALDTEEWKKAVQPPTKSRQKLTLLAVACIVVIAFFIVPKVRHPSSKPLLASTLQLRREESAPVQQLALPPPIQSAKRREVTLVKGVDYFADYDIASISMPVGQGFEYPARPVFHYVTQETSPYPIKVLSYSPRVIFVQDFMTEEECDFLINTALKSITRSEVVPHLGDKDQSTVSDIRTSSQAWVNRDSHPIVANLYKRILTLVGFPDDSPEAMQILRYEVGQKYIAHEDYFDPVWYGPQKTNRALTFYMYLSDVEEGGETQFPRADGKPPTNDFTSCTAGLLVRPHRRSVAIFYDMKPNGEFDDRSLHGSCPVKKGVKWGATLWLRLPTPNGKTASLP
jgi:prolyl 4-hydroxylase